MKVALVARAILLVLSVSGVAAGTCPDKGSFSPKVASVERGEQRFNISMSYCLNEMTVGRTVSVTVRIQSDSPKSSQLEMKGMPGVVGADPEHIKFLSNTFESENGPGLSVRNYIYNVKISEQAKPRGYSIQVDLGFPDSDPDKQRFHPSFDLWVGVNSGGKLEISREAQQSFKAAMFSTEKHEYKVKLSNSFPDYEANIEKIHVSSEPEGWIEPMDIPLEEEFKVATNGERTVKFAFETAPLSKHLIDGLRGLAVQLKFEVTYNDGYRRRFDSYEALQPISITPTALVLLVAVLMGLLLGAIVRGMLEFMLFKKTYSRRGLIRVVSYSLVFGLLVVMFAAAGQVEVKAKAVSLSSSYDNPVAMLMMGLISALAGLQIIIGWYKSLKSD
jgi:hypothetical protein